MDDFGAPMYLLRILNACSNRAISYDREIWSKQSLRSSRKHFGLKLTHN